MLNQEKLLRIYGYIKDNFYLCYPDVSIGKDKFNSNLLFGLLTSLNKGKQLQMGEYGQGKTTSSEYLLSMIYGIPPNVLAASTIKGNNEITVEKIIGRLNLGQLNQGTEKVIWSLFVTLEPKIIDEFNRIPGPKQNLFLDGLARGNWNYLNEMISNGDFSLFATANYKDSGNTTIMDAALDRFQVAVESKHPGVNNSRVLRNNFDGEKDTGALIAAPDIEQKLYDVMKQDIDYSEKQKLMECISEDYRKLVESRTGLSLINKTDISQIIQEISKIPIEKEAGLFLDYFIAEMYSCGMFGQKRSNEDCVPNCHYQKLLCGKKKNSDSVRNNRAELKYAKGLAWLLGDKAVSTQHLITVLPYNLWHKMRFVDSFVNDYKEDKREDPLQLYCTKKAIEDVYSRFSKAKGDLGRMFHLMETNNIAEAEKLANEAKHPVFTDYLKID